MTITAHSAGSEPGARAPDSDAEAKRLRRLERSLDSRPLDAWERYRGLIGVVDDYRALLDSADKKTRFALIIMGLSVLVTLLAFWGLTS